MPLFLASHSLPHNEYVGSSLLDVYLAQLLQLPHLLLLRNDHYLAERLFLLLPEQGQPLLNQRSLILCFIFNRSCVCLQLLRRFASDNVDYTVYLFVSLCPLRLSLGVGGVELEFEGVFAVLELLVGLPAFDDEEDELPSGCVCGGQREQVEEFQERDEGRSCS